MKYKVSSLYAPRLKFDLLCIYNIVHGLRSVSSQDFFQFDGSSHTRGHKFKVKLKYTRLDIRKHLFSSRVIPLWNDLPSECVDSSSLGAFESMLHNYLLSRGIR